MKEYNYVITVKHSGIVYAHNKKEAREEIKYIYDDVDIDLGDMKIEVIKK